MATMQLCLTLVLALGAGLGSLPQCQGEDDGFTSDPLSDFFRGMMNSAGSFINNAASEAVRYAVNSTVGEEICFSALGCFSLQAPWVSAERPLPPPAEPEDLKPFFYIYSRAAPERFTIESAPTMSLEDCAFDGSKPTFFIVHGYFNDGNTPWMSDLKDALLETVDGNVVLVDWGRGSMDSYFKVAANSRVVARQIAQFGHHLINAAGAHPADFHFLGHSLGAHICAYACRNITNCGRLTALDPAGPGFEALAREVRVATDAATFVEAIHTNAKPVTAMGFGMMRPVAHMDFYVNGGVDQPGCETPSTRDQPTSEGDWFALPINAVSDMIGCSHGRAYEYFTEVVRNRDCIMWGHKVSLAKQFVRWTVGEWAEVPARSGECRRGRCVPMGMDSILYPARGAFSVTTNLQKPFCVKERSEDGQDLAVLKQLGYL